MLVVLPVTNFFVSVFNAYIEARRLHAAYQTAEILKTHNADFRNWSYGELVNAIMDEKQPLVKK